MFDEQQGTSTRMAPYGDGRTYAIPSGWPETTEAMRATALEATLAALEPGVVDRLDRYYDPDGGYSGLLFATAGDNPAYDVSAADLWAVSTLSVQVDSRQARRIFDASNARIVSLLHALPVDTALSDLEHSPLGSAVTLDRMWDLHLLFKTLTSTDDRDSNRWVFASKLCARKRPGLFPVRDSLVCQHLAGGQSLVERVPATSAPTCRFTRT
ncbi:DUF6308 family protein [Nocardioides sp. CPCC 205120]|uniref:DUF6308 family protein n=1 Tax=Nocardioides sp. CPCC 205120 TaxID=3406462 RepID=UPI003B50954B